MWKLPRNCFTLAVHELQVQRRIVCAEMETNVSFMFRLVGDSIMAQVDYPVFLEYEKFFYEKDINKHG